MGRELLRHLQNWKLPEDQRDIRGRLLRAPDGRALGRIMDLVLDMDAGTVDSIVLEDGSEYRASELDVRENDVHLRRKPTSRRGAGPLPQAEHVDEEDRIRVEVWHRDQR
jgi:sporulation protein YlmC with PRC-barrel domain